MVKILFLVHCFPRKKTNLMVKIPLQPKGYGFKPFSDFFFSFMNEIDKNKLSFDKKIKLVAQEQFFQKEPCFSRNKG
jgi:hypothetical protein